MQTRLFKILRLFYECKIYTRITKKKTLDFLKFVYKWNYKIHARNIHGHTQTHTNTHTHTHTHTHEHTHTH